MSEKKEVLLPVEKQAIRIVRDAVLDAIEAAGPMGAPAGHMYAAFMDYLSLETFTAFMSAMCQAGLIRKEGHLYFFVRRPGAQS